jgi:hypothetical protein
MKTYARIIDGQAVDVTATDPTEIFHGDVAAQFVEVPAGTEIGDLYDGKAWSRPAQPAAPAAPPAPYGLLTPMTLYMAFTPGERIAIKTSSDPMVKEFWEMYQLSVQLGKPTDPNLASVQGAIAYLARSKEADPPGVGILATEERVDQILQGIPQ